MASKPVGLVVTVENDNGWYGDDRVYLSGRFIGLRPYDGSDDDQVIDEVLEVLAELVAKKLKWKRDSTRGAE